MVIRLPELMAGARYLPGQLLSGTQYPCSSGHAGDRLQPVRRPCPAPAPLADTGPPQNSRLDVVMSSASGWVRSGEAIRALRTRGDRTVVFTMTGAS